MRELLTVKTIKLLGTIYLLFSSMLLATTGNELLFDDIDGVEINIPIWKQLQNTDKQQSVFIDTSQKTSCYPCNLPQYNFNKSKENNPSDITDWELMGGPTGGSVRHFRAFGDSLFALADQEVFILKENIWEPINLRNSLKNSILDIYVYPTGLILVSTDWGVYISDDQGKKWFMYSVDNNYPYLMVFEINKTPTGEILLATENGIYKSNSTGRQFTLLTLSGTVVYSFDIDNKGNIWAGTMNGILKAKYGEYLWQIMDVPSSYYTKILCDSDSMVYAVGQKQILRSNDLGLTWYSLSASYSDITLTHNDDLLITTPYEVMCSNGDKIELLDLNSSKFYLTSFELTDNNIFLGTLGSGIFKYNILNKEFHSANNGLNVATFRGIVTMGNEELLACTDADSIYKSIDNGENWYSVKKAWSRCMTADKHGNVYVAADYGLIRSTDNGESWDELAIDVYPYYISAIGTDDNGDVICAGTSRGDIYLSTDGGSVFKLIDQVNYYINAIEVVDSNNYLIGSDSLYFLSVEENNYKTIKNPLIRDCVDIVCDNYGYYFLATNSHIYKSADAKNWELIKNFSRIMYLTADRFSNIYIAMSNGKTLVSLNSGDTWEVIADPIYFTHFWSFELSQDGYLFFGSQDKGLYRKIITLTPRDILSFEVSNNYPNPFSSKTQIIYSTPEFCSVTISIYDILGHLIETQNIQHRMSGTYTFTWEPRNTPSGIYLYRVCAGNENFSGKMLYIK
jgi:ligand-binding sensor domain-containing protein